MARTRRRCFVIASVLLAVLGSSSAARAAEAGTGPEVTILLYNDAHIPESDLALAEQQATRIFLQSGIRSRWLDCFALATQQGVHCGEVWGPRVFLLRIVLNGRGFDDTVFGTAYLSGSTAGKYADVFYDRIERMHAIWHTSRAGLLGYVAAHEIGHLLLGSHSHAPIGIMRAHWQAEEIRQISMGSLFFSPQQARQMRTRLEAEDAVRLTALGK